MRSNRTLLYFSAYIKNLPQLTFKEKDVLLKRLKKTTLKKIGLGYNVTEARIRQIEKTAIKKMATKTYQQSLFQLIRSLRRAGRG